MKFSVTSSSASGDDSNFDEIELRKLLREKDHEAVIAKFLTILAEMNDAKGYVVAVRGGKEPTQPLCPTCFSHRVWVGSKDSRVLTCPGCLWAKFKGVEIQVDGATKGKMSVVR